jgi:hypothetical protein
VAICFKLHQWTLQALSFVVTLEEHWYHCTTRSFQKMHAKSKSHVGDRFKDYVGSFLCPLNCPCYAVIRRKRIYNFRCSMLVLHQLLCVLFTLCGIFMHFLELTY